MVFQIGQRLLGSSDLVIERYHFWREWFCRGRRGDEELLARVVPVKASLVKAELAVIADLNVLEIDAECALRACNLVRWCRTRPVVPVWVVAGAVEVVRAVVATLCAVLW